MERMKKIAAIVWSGMRRAVSSRVFAAVLMCSVTLSMMMGVSSHTRVYTMRDGDTTRVVVTLSDAPYLSLDGRDILWVDTTAEPMEEGMSVEVQADGQSTLLYLTDENITVSDALTQAGVSMGELDELNQEKDTIVTDGMLVQVDRVVYEVEVCADGETKLVEIAERNVTVADTLSRAGITLGELDRVSVDKNAFITGSVRVQVDRVVYKVEVCADGKSTTIDVTQRNVTVADALTRAGVTVGKQDRVSADQKAEITGSMKVQVDRVTYEDYTVTETIPFKTTYRYSGVLKPNATKVDRAGRNGEREVTYRKCIVNGEVESKEQISEKVTKTAVNKVVLRGSSYGTPISKTPSGVEIELNEKNQPLNYSRKIYGSCTAYHGDTATSTGRKPGVGVVAVDPREIPYGSILWIASPDGKFVYGYAIAGDTGGFIHNSETVVDLYMDSVQEMNSFGRRNLNVYVIKEGNGK